MNQRTIRKLEEQASALNVAHSNPVVRDDAARRVAVKRNLFSSLNIDPSIPSEIKTSHNEYKNETSDQKPSGP